ncbi:MAG: hypothetical protein EU532_05535 [Promethearchaeota archaeon]|nr:MAG: hypothetical protein EU532_05535 [Candidatus Lokiarchaeota archaeon]
MFKTPKEVYHDFKKKEIDKLTAEDLLIYLLENAKTDDIRIECLKILQKIGSKNQKIFSILENLLISDSNEEIRILAANILKILFRDKFLIPLRWALQHETSWQFLMDIILTITEINDENAKSILIEKIKNFENYKFNSSLSNLFKNKHINNFKVAQLAEIASNYIIIKYFVDTLKQIKFQVKNGLVTELDLSFTSNDISGWKILKDLSKFIGSLKKLKKLILKSNRISPFPESILSLKSLKYLDLSHNEIKKLPENISSCESLEYLNLRYNNLLEIPNSIGDLKNLKILDLKHNKLSTLPPLIQELSGLEVLNLHGNLFTTLPKSIEGLPSLKKLKLGLNNLNYVPKWIKSLCSLKMLGLGGNKALSDDFENWIDFLPSLHELNLYDSNIRKLPKSIGKLDSLEKLIIPNNKLSSLPESFKQLKNLRKLDLSWNDITYLPEWINSLKLLEELNLRGNKLEDLPETISELKQLKVLNITLNKNMIQIPKDLINKDLKIYR